MSTFSAESASLPKQASWSRTGDLARQYGSFGALLLLVIAASVLSPDFLTTTNIFLMLRQAAALGIVAIGQTYVILTGGIDLTVGSLLSLSVVLVTSLLQWNDARILPLLFLVIGVGALVGIINGSFITRLKIPPIVMTLGMMTLLQGLGLMYTKGVPQNTLTDTFRFLGLGKIWIVPVPVVVWAVVIVVAVVLLYFTNFGRYVYAVGGNSEAARLSGVNVNLITTLCYVLCGVTAAIAGYVLAARLGVGDNWVGGTYTLDSIAAVAIGGTSLAGGRGGVATTVAGVLLLAVLYNLLLLLGVVYFWQEVVKGLIILGGVILYTARR
jgi:ribose/xylose/arabinose/galactoside ABC-type transport system permease subunit